MHINPESRRTAFESLVYCLEKDGILVLTLRRGPEVPERHIFIVSKEEVCQLAEQYRLELIKDTDSPDYLGRENITWTTMVFRKPHENARWLTQCCGDT
jgi:hypothetical protein